MELIQQDSASTELRDLVRAGLELAQKKNSSFSLRAYAKRLGVAASFLSDYLQGKRKLSQYNALKIIQNLKISQGKKNELLSKLNLNVTLEDFKLQLDQYQLVSDEIYYSILCLIETCNFKNDITWIAKRLARTENEVRNALATLIKLGHIEIDENGNFILKTAHLSTSDSIVSLSLRHRHAKNLNDAISSLNNVPVDKRYFSFETLSFNAKNIDKVQKLVANFFDQLVILSSAESNNNEVYEFNFNCFPRTKEGTTYEN